MRFGAGSVGVRELGLRWFMTKEVDIGEQYISILGSDSSSESSATASLAAGAFVWQGNSEMSRGVTKLGALTSKYALPPHPPPTDIRGGFQGRWRKWVKCWLCLEGAVPPPETLSPARSLMPFSVGKNGSKL